MINKTLHPFFKQNPLLNDIRICHLSPSYSPFTPSSYDQIGSAGEKEEWADTIANVNTST